MNVDISSVIAVRVCLLAFALASFPAFAADTSPGSAGEPYPNMAAIAPIGERIGKCIDVSAAARGPAVDSAKGYRLQDLGRGLYMVTGNACQPKFLVYETGVVVIDAPPSFAAKLPQAIAEITPKPITHLIHGHSHIDHIGGAKSLGGHPIIIAQEETLRLLKRAADPNRPLPIVTFADRYTLKVGTQVLELSYHGDAVMSPASVRMRTSTCRPSSWVT